MRYGFEVCPRRRRLWIFGTGNYRCVPVASRRNEIGAGRTLHSTNCSNGRPPSSCRSRDVDRVTRGIRRRTHRCSTNTRYAVAVLRRATVPGIRRRRPLERWRPLPRALAGVLLLITPALSSAEDALRRRSITSIIDNRYRARYIAALRLALDSMDIYAKLRCGTNV